MIKSNYDNSLVMGKSKNFTQKEKINILFDYIFNGEKHIEEEIFWNKLNKADIHDLNKRGKEENISFDELKSSL